MHILVTGGAGFIGGHFAERFLRDEYDVIVLDSMHPYSDLGLKRHTIDVSAEVTSENGMAHESIEGDVRDADLIAELVDRAEYVFHQAGRAGVHDSVAEPRVSDAVNVDGTVNSLDAARNTDIERIVMASSS